MSFNNKSYDLVKQLNDLEKENAIKNYGATFNSFHEAYAVLLEEVEEAEHELEQIKGYLNRIWTSIKSDEVKECISSDLVLIALASEYMVLEGAQVHAVTDKFIKTLQKDIEE